MEEKLPIQKWAIEDRPREKLILKGRDALSDAELLAILIGSGSKRMSAVDLGKHILNQCQNDLNKLAKLSVKELSKFNGIGPAKAISIVSALELGRRRNTQVSHEDKISDSKSVYELMIRYLKDLDHEQFYVLYLNRNNIVQKTHKLSIGGVSGTVVDIKMIFKIAFEELSSSIILVHNHPSGNINPSDADRKITSNIRNACELMSIKLLDHIIFTNQTYFSFADEGII